jgi:hypothetical protein
MSGAQLLGLNIDFNIWRSNGIGDLRCAVTDNDMESLCPKLASRIEHAGHHGLSTNRVEYLWQFGFHTSATTCGKDNDFKHLEINSELSQKHGTAV